jgi:hypothetical protein
LCWLELWVLFVRVVEEGKCEELKSKLQLIIL